MDTNSYEAPAITTIGSLHEMTLDTGKTLGSNDGFFLVGIPGVADGTVVGDVPTVS